MKEASDPKLDGFMRWDEIVQHMASGWRLGRDDDEYFITQTAGKVRSDTLGRLIDEGWIQSRNTCYVLTDVGRLAYMRSTDELGDGVLRPPDPTTSAPEGQK